MGEISYPFAPQPPYPQGLSVWGNLYKVNLGDRFDSWLQPGQPVQYVILIEQTTRSGVTYTSGMKINLIVDKVTPSPDIQYYSPTEANKPLQNDTILQDTILQDN